MEPTFFATPQAFRAWLEANHETATELSVGFRKRSTGLASITWPQAVDQALCFGWIDGVRRRIDEHTYSIRFTPRKPSSIWSAVNIAKVEQLQAAGRMTQAGLAAFAHRTVGKSAIYSHEQADAAQLPVPMLRAFQRNKTAWRFFNDSTPPSYRKQMLHWVTSAKRPETRAARFAQLLAACAAQERIDLWIRKKHPSLP